MDNKKFMDKLCYVLMDAGILQSWYYNSEGYHIKIKDDLEDKIKKIEPVVKQLGIFAHFAGGN